MTITEALQEIKTLTARIQKKREAVAKYIVRDSRIRDPFEAEGGSEKWIAQERQSIADLEMGIIKIRLGIQAANFSNLLKIGDRETTVAAWLTWRREISAHQKAFLQTLFNSITITRQQIQQKGGRMVVGQAAASATVNLDQNAPIEVVVSVNEQGVIKQIEEMETVLGTLDGKLSLFNATTQI